MFDRLRLRVIQRSRTRGRASLARCVSCQGSAPG
jgi:hypothetical protein